MVWISSTFLVVRFSGSIRLRDRPTLVLTGVIQEQDTATAAKWPLDDLPLIGQFSVLQAQIELKMNWLFL